MAPLKAIVDAQSLYAVYDDTKKPIPQDGDTEWVRIKVGHRRGTRASAGRRSDGKARHTQAGLLFIEIYTPKDDGLERSDVLCALFAESLRTSDGPVWYGDVTAVEEGDDGNWYRADVIAEFEYDLIQ